MVMYLSDENSIMKIVFLLLVLVTVVSGQCGRPQIARGRVVGGKDAVSGSWPWQIGMLKYGEFECGGALVSPRWVVTAAHCVYGHSEQDIEIVLGDYDRTRKEGTEQHMKVQRILTYPGYNPLKTGLNNDIALIQLSRPAILNEYVQPVCLPSTEESPAVGSKCTITGWGKTRIPGRPHPILQELDLRVLGNPECKKLNGNILIQVTNQMLCASNGQDSGQAGCHGDSGGPFVCQQSDGSYKLHGAVSWGSTKCNPRQSPTVFARVADFVDWINHHISTEMN